MNKTAFDYSFNAMTMVSEQNEKMVQTFLSQASWMPDTGKNAIQEWLKAYRNGFSEYKKLVDENYAGVEAFFNESEDYLYWYATFPLDFFKATGSDKVPQKEDLMLKMTESSNQTPGGLDALEHMFSMGKTS